MSVLSSRESADARVPGVSRRPSSREAGLWLTRLARSCWLVIARWLFAMGSIVVFYCVFSLVAIGRRAVGIDGLDRSFDQTLATYRVSPRAGAGSTMRASDAVGSRAFELAAALRAARKLWLFPLLLALTWVAKMDTKHRAKEQLRVYTMF